MTPRSAWFFVYIVSTCLLSLCSPSASAAVDFTFYHENVMGTSLELRVRAEDRTAAGWAEERVLDEIDRLSKVFSGYDKSSELSRWQSGLNGPVTVSPELFEVLEASELWQARSGGAFDPRVEGLTRLWVKSAKLGRIPTPEEIANVRLLFNQPAWRLNPLLGTAERLTNSPLTLNAIAKGYIVEKACDAALDRNRGVRGLLLNVGGDLRVCGDLVRTIGIANPAADSETTAPIAYVEVQDRAVATSGNYQRGLRIGGQWYSHIFDPRSGLPAIGVAHATVIAERSADADALDTILNVLSHEEGLRLVKSLPGVECLIVTSEGRIIRSGGWARYERPQPGLLAIAVAQSSSPPATKTDGPKTDGKVSSKAPPENWWGNRWELVVNLEINRSSGESQRYRRPYVVVWVEDKKEKPVRTLTLWVSQTGAGPDQWLPDLKRWYRGEEARKQVETVDVVHTIARATRPPGKYTIIWDGKDNYGKPLDSGEYTLCIEAAREHGTYQSMRKAVTIGEAPFSFDLKGDVELKSASIEYRRKAASK
jgi:FAD:protein FMN transferase